MTSPAKIHEIGGDDLQWESVISGNRQFKEQLQSIRLWLKGNTFSFLSNEQLNVPPSLQLDQVNLDKVIAGPTTHTSEILSSKKLSPEDIYDTEKSIAFAEITAMLMHIAESNPNYRVSDFRALVAQSTISLAEKFKDANEFTFQELSTELNNLLMANSDRLDRDATTNLRGISENIVAAVKSETLEVPLSESTMKGLKVWIGLGRMLFQVRGKGLDKKVVSQESTTKTSENISNLLEMITGGDQSDSTYSPILAGNAALILPIQLYNLRIGSAEYISPEPD